MKSRMLIYSLIQKMMTYTYHPEVTMNIFCKKYPMRKNLNSLGDKFHPSSEGEVFNETIVH